jgi:hypothetical protein
MTCAASTCALKHSLTRARTHARAHGQGAHASCMTQDESVLGRDANRRTRTDENKREGAAADQLCVCTLPDERRDLSESKHIERDRDEGKHREGDRDEGK